MGVPAGQSSGCTLVEEAPDSKNTAAVKVGNKDTDEATTILLMSTPGGLSPALRAGHVKD
jgi:hypothetical protein